MTKVFCIRQTVPKAVTVLEYIIAHTSNLLVKATSLQYLALMHIELRQHDQALIRAKEAITLIDSIVTDEFSQIKGKALLTLTKCYVAL
jgi:hypothetical protein